MSTSTSSASSRSPGSGGGAGASPPSSDLLTKSASRSITITAGTRRRARPSPRSARSTLLYSTRAAHCSNRYTARPHLPRAITPIKLHPTTQKTKSKLIRRPSQGGAYSSAQESRTRPPSQASRSDAVARTLSTVIHASIIVILKMNF